jgi:hypothetical protein
MGFAAQSGEFWALKRTIRWHEILLNLKVKASCYVRLRDGVRRSDGVRDGCFSATGGGRCGKTPVVDMRHEDELITVAATQTFVITVGRLGFS